MGIEDNIIIYANLSQDMFNNSYTKRWGPNIYEINLDPIVGHNLGTLRHELYHIADGHCDDMEKISDPLVRGLKYYYYYEPQAILYDITGLKL